MSNAKSAIVTGSSKGIGRAIVEKLASDGYNVVINYLSSKEEANLVVSYIEATYDVRAIAIRADVSVTADVQNLISKTLQAFGKISVLVNNAGILPLPQFWADLSKEKWTQTLDVNLYGTLTCIQHVVPHMKAAGQGDIVNISSTFGIEGSPYVLAYAISKAGLITLTKSLAKVLAPEITINSIAPSNIDTEMTRNAGDEFVQKVIADTPLQRLGSSAEVANAVSYLCSGGYITGQTLIVDGGYTL